MSLDKNMPILVVDDSGTMRLMFEKMLKEIGFKNFTLATNGNDAIEKLQSETFSLVISDWNMPQKNGLELLQWVRKDEKHKTIPFIMATAQGDKSQQELARNEGASGHVSKPFDSAELIKKIEDVFGVKGEEVKEKSQEKKLINGKVPLKVAHIQITDHLALGILKHNIDTGKVTPKYFELETECLPGWNPVQDKFEKGDVDCAFVLAPIAMDLYAYNAPIKLVLFAHKNGSSFVRSKNFSNNTYDSLKDYYKYKVVDIPHKMSIHNMLAHMYLTDLGLKPGVPGEKPIDVRFEVVPPIQMPKIMKENETVGGFIVAEPIASNAIANDIAELEFLSASLWPNHPCCVVAMRDDFINKYEDAVFEFTSLIVEAGRYVDTNPSQAAEIAVNFLDPNKKLGLTQAILRRVLEEPKGIKLNDLYPVLKDLTTIQDYMHEQMEIGKLIDIEKFVDLRFADAACKG